MATTTKNEATNNATKEMKGEENMSKAFDEEMDLRTEDQKTAEAAGEQAQSTDVKAADEKEPNFFQKHKKAFIIGGCVVAGVAVVGGTVWGIHNIGCGKTFFGGSKVKTPEFKVDTIPTQGQMVAPMQQADIPATETQPAQVVNFADGAAKVADATKATSNLKVASL